MKDSHHPRLRVAAIIVENGRILMARHRRAGVEYFVLPGGGVEYGESMEEALVRELQEEANLDIQVGAPVFLNDSVPPDKHRHIVNIYFLASVVGGTLAVGAGDKRLVGMEFVPLDAVPNLTLYPDIRQDLVSGLASGFSEGTRYLGNLWRD